MVEGFTYVADGSPGLLAGAQAGARVRIPALDPPWIVVDHSIENVVVARWPGRLLRVASVPPADDEERAALERAADNLRADAGYSRVIAVDVLAELPAALLFGPQGEAVAEVLNVAGNLTLASASDLAATRPPDADQAYSRAWQRWLDQQPNAEPYRYRDHAGVLAIPGAGQAQSPVGGALTLAWASTAASARRCAGPAAFRISEHGEEVLLDPWATAATALLDAAMALGAPGLTGPDDAVLLTAAWRQPRPAGPEATANLLPKILVSEASA